VHGYASSIDILPGLCRLPGLADCAGPETNLVNDPHGVIIGATNKVTQSGDGECLFAISPTGGLGSSTQGSGI